MKPPKRHFNKSEHFWEISTLDQKRKEISAKKHMVTCSAHPTPKKKFQ
jgi:hypothetical protein